MTCFKCGLEVTLLQKIKIKKTKKNKLILASRDDTRVVSEFCLNLVQAAAHGC